jgi:hypothetical protein
MGKGLIYLTPALVASYDVRDLMTQASGMASTATCFEEPDSNCSFIRQ